jgi:hypothetical protein
MSNAERVIFLDIDGVICCNMVGHLEENKLAELKRIVDETGAKVRHHHLKYLPSIDWNEPLTHTFSPFPQVVLSTDWRRQAHLKKQLREVLARLNIECIGATPMRAMFQPVRPQEITSWLARSTHTIGAWVAIDDRNLLNEHGGAALQGHFVHTNPASGLTPALADKAISILRRAGSPSSAFTDRPQSASAFSVSSLQAALPSPNRYSPSLAPPSGLHRPPPGNASSSAGSFSLESGFGEHAYGGGGLSSPYRDHAGYARAFGGGQAAKHGEVPESYATRRAAHEAQRAGLRTPTRTSRPAASIFADRR